MAAENTEKLGGHFTGLPPSPRPRIDGLTTKLYVITNNFETYMTLEAPSQEYYMNYISYCLHQKNMELKDIVFKVEKIIVFLNNTRINKY